MAFELVDLGDDVGAYCWDQFAEAAAERGQELATGEQVLEFIGGGPYEPFEGGNFWVPTTKDGEKDWFQIGEEATFGSQLENFGEWPAWDGDEVAYPSIRYMILVVKEEEEEPEPEPETEGPAPGTLKVTLIRANNLHDGDFAGKSDPYVTFELEQDNWIGDRDMGEFESSHKEDTCNPEWNEEFTFGLDTLDNMVLTVKVWDDDTLRDDCLGDCKINLEELGLPDGEIFEHQVVVDSNFFSADGTVDLLFQYGGAQ